MDTNRIGLFDLAERRLAWADQRRVVLAQNIANANTPGFKPHDLKSFAATLGGAGTVAQVRTQPNHLSAAGATALARWSIARIRNRPTATPSQWTSSS